MAIRIVFLVTVIVCSALFAGPGFCDGQSDSTRTGPPARIGFFLDSGVMLGSETKLERYQRSHFRIYTEGGVELRRPRSEGSAGRGLGLAVFFAPGDDEGRFGGGLRFTHDLAPRWTGHGMVGLLASSEEEERGLFERGLQVRGSLLYRDTGSLGLIWHTLPYDFNSQYGGEKSGWHQSLYLLGMLHGRPGAILSGAILTTYLVLGVVFIASGAAY